MDIHNLPRRLFEMYMHMVCDGKDTLRYEPGRLDEQIPRIDDVLRLFSETGQIASEVIHQARPGVTYDINVFAVAFYVVPEILSTGFVNGKRDVAAMKTIIALAILKLSPKEAQCLRIDSYLRAYMCARGDYRLSQSTPAELRRLCGCQQCALPQSPNSTVIDSH